jgi:hypothetical protein
MKKQALITAILILLIFAGKGIADGLTDYLSAGGGLNLFLGGSTISGSNPLYVTTTGHTPVAQADITSVNANVPASSTAVTLSAASSDIEVWTTTDAAPLHINWANGTATTSNAALAPGSAYHYGGTPISAFKVIGDSATGKYNYTAN